jgi:hypothetical protein
MKSLKQNSPTNHVRQLAKTFSYKQIANCINEQIETQSNSCTIYGENTQVLNILSRAGVVRRLVDEGTSLSDAMRELGRRIRNLLTNN